MKKNQVQFLVFVLCSLAVLGTLYILFNNKGFVKYRRIKSQVDSLYLTADSLKKDIIILQNSIDSLKNNIPQKITRIAREKYNMKKPGEEVINVEEK